MNTITRVLHSIFNHRKDIVYRRSSSILISVIRISYRKINLYECPFNYQRRLGLGVAYVALLVKVPGSRLGKLFFYLRCFFFILNKTRTVRGSDYSPAIELSEQKDKLVTATGDTEKYSEKQANKVWLNSVYWFSRY